MKTMENQQVTPSWGVDMNDKRRTLPAKVGSPQVFATLAEVTAWVNGDAEREAWVCDKVAKQGYISGGDRYFGAKLKAAIPQQADEKQEAYFARTFAKAREVLAGMAFPSLVEVLDFAFESRRGAEPEAVDPVIVKLRAGWDDADEDKRGKVLVALGIAPEFVEGEAEDIVTAYVAGPKHAEWQKAADAARVAAAVAKAAKAAARAQNAEELGL